MRSTKPKDFRWISSASIDAQAASRPTLCGDPSNSASKSETPFVGELVGHVTTHWQF